MRHDGPLGLTARIPLQVDGQRYFRCKHPGQGLLEPARNVTWHGHNVDHVLREEDYNLASPREIEEAEHHK